jgi:spore coat polysaccharide biosynthesis protein SpsF
MNIVAIIPVRTESSRLPDKVLFDIMGKSVMERVIERVKGAGIDKVVVATSMTYKNLRVSRICDRIGIPCFIGHETNVLHRYYHCAQKYQADHILRITQDCPLIDPEVIRRTVDYYFEQEADFGTARLDPKAYPDGMDVEIFKFEVLKAAYENATEQYEFEHVTPWMFNRGIYKVVNTPSERRYGEEVKFSMDTKADYEVVKAVYKALYPVNPLFGLDEIMRVTKHVAKEV